jgi:restriction system protein
MRQPCGAVHKLRDLTDFLAKSFSLTLEEQSLLLPSGTQPVFANRVGWAKTYLKKAGLIESPNRGFAKISEQGKLVLKDNLQEISKEFLKQFSTFQEFANTKKRGSETEGSKAESSITQPETNSPNSDGLTPLETLEAAHGTLRSEVVSDLLQKVRASSPEFFEDLVVKVLVAMGYGGNFKEASRRVGRTDDGGIDGIIKEDLLGFDVIYVQAKRWEGTVGRPELQKFAGALLGQKARKGAFLTTSNFSQNAYEYVATLDAKIVLVDGLQLANFMLDYGVGVSVALTYAIYKIDEDFFEPI